MPSCSKPIAMDMPAISAPKIGDQGVAAATIQRGFTQ